MSQDSSFSQDSTLTVIPETGDSEVLYFAYGSNLSSAQMLRRCPSSVPVGLAYLPGWRWIINERGYANVVSLEPDPGAGADGEAEGEGEGEGSQEIMDGVDGVYGVLYLLPETDEAKLDRYEGVPWAYQKTVLDVEIVPEPPAGGDEAHVPVRVKVVRALVYVDGNRVGDGTPRDEYVGRMNEGIREATKEWGLPRWYVDRVMRKFIPEGATAASVAKVAGGGVSK